MIVRIDKKEFKVEKADTFWKRFKGLMMRDNYMADKTMLISPCNSIHMFFMKFPLTVVFIDKQYKITDVKIGIKPWQVKLSLFKGSEAVFEIPYWGNENLKPKVGDYVTVIQ